MRRIVGMGLGLLLLGAGDERAAEPALRQALRALTPPEGGRLSRQESGRAGAALRLVGGQPHRSQGSSPGQIRWVDPSTEIAVELPEEASDRFWISSTGGRFGVRRGFAARAGAASDRLVRLSGRDGAEGLLWAHEGGVEELWKIPERGFRAGYEVELPPGWSLAEVGVGGQVEVRDERRGARARVSFGRAWGSDGREVSVRVRVSGATITAEPGEEAGYPVWIDPLWVSSRTMVLNRLDPLLAPLPDGRLLVVGGVEAGVCEIFDPLGWTFTATGAMTKPRRGGKAIRLRDGRVMVAGGEGPEGEALGEVELYDPAQGAFTAAAMTTARRGPAVAPIPGGVLVAGGEVDGKPSATTERWQNDSFAPASPMNLPRYLASATAMQGGSVLVAGGSQSSRQAELYLPEKGLFKPTAEASSTHRGDRAVELASGDVLLFDDTPPGGILEANLAEVYLRKLGVFSIQGKLSDLNPTLAGHRGLALPGGQTLLVGPGQSSKNNVVLFDPQLGRPTSLEIPGVGLREEPGLAMLPTGQVAVIGGVKGATVGTAKVGYLERISYEMKALLSSGTSPSPAQLQDGRYLTLGAAEDISSGAPEDPLLFDPQRMTFETTLGDPGIKAATAVTLASGRVMAIASSNPSLAHRTWLFDPQRDRWQDTGLFTSNSLGVAATRLLDGRVVISGGGVSASPTQTLQFFSSALEIFEDLLVLMPTARLGHNQVTLASGKVLLGGGSNPAAPAELFDPNTLHFKEVSGEKPSLAQQATLLYNGDVLLSGGIESPFLPATLTPWLYYDAKTNSLSQLGGDQGSQGHLQSRHRALLLSDHRVLIAGGDKNDINTPVSVPALPVLFDPKNKSLSQLKPLNHPRYTPCCSRSPGARWR